MIHLRIGERSLSQLAELECDCCHRDGAVYLRYSGACPDVQWLRAWLRGHCACYGWTTLPVKVAGEPHTIDLCRCCAASALQVLGTLDPQ